ncbi:MAG: hypothetical protein ACH346_06095 [Chthoniobacterales bacterium]
MKTNIKLLISLALFLSSGQLIAEWQPDTKATVESAEIVNTQVTQVTVSDYCDFLNHTAVSDPYHLYDDAMGSDPDTACITRVGVPGSFHYEVIAGRENFPVSYVNFFNKKEYSAKEEYFIFGNEENNDPYLKSNLDVFEVIRTSTPALTLSAPQATPQTSNAYFNHVAEVAGLVVLTAFAHELMVRGDANAGEAMNPEVNPGVRQAEVALAEDVPGAQERTLRIENAVPAIPVVELRPFHHPNEEHPNEVIGEFSANNPLLIIASHQLAPVPLGDLFLHTIINMYPPGNSHRENLEGWLQIEHQLPRDFIEQLYIDRWSELKQEEEINLRRREVSLNKSMAEYVARNTASARAHMIEARRIANPKIIQMCHEVANDAARFIVVDKEAGRSDRVIEAINKTEQARIALQQLINKAQEAEETFRLAENEKIKADENQLWISSFWFKSLRQLEAEAHTVEAIANLATQWVEAVRNAEIKGSDLRRAEHSETQWSQAALAARERVNNRIARINDRDSEQRSHSPSGNDNLGTPSQNIPQFALDAWIAAVEDAEKEKNAADDAWESNFEKK